MPRWMSCAINHVLILCVCIISICIFVAMKYFFPYISVYFGGTMSSRLGIVLPRYLSLQIDYMCLSVPVYSVIHSLPVVIVSHIVCSLWIWMEMWDKQMICWYEANIGNGSVAGVDNVGRNLDGKETYVGKRAVECSWMLMGLSESVGLSILRLSVFWILYKE